MKKIQKIKCWWRGYHTWTTPFRNLYTDYELWHQNCVVCGKSRWWDVEKKDNVKLHKE